MVNTGGLILHKTGHRNGRKHDYDIYKRNHPTITPSQVDNIVDSFGYLGIEKDYPTIKSVLPIRKKKNTLLSNDDVRYNNKNHSSKTQDHSRTYHMQDQEVWNNGC